jgi:hypothetical protein
MQTLTTAGSGQNAPTCQNIAYWQGAMRAKSRWIHWFSCDAIATIHEEQGLEHMRVSADIVRRRRIEV